MNEPKSNSPDGEVPRTDSWNARSHHDAQLPDPDSEDAIANVFFGNFVLIDELGSGGMKTVYRAHQHHPAREVALAVPRLPSGADLTRFQTEVNAVARLEHPNIVPIYEVGEHQGRPYFTMAFIRGESLADHVAAGPLDCRQAAKMVASVAEALDFAHSKGVLHRDVKPENILLDESEKPYLTDFGLAKLLDSGVQHTVHGEGLGTPRYVSPEQARGDYDQVSAASDVYSLGVTLVESLVGRKYFIQHTQGRSVQRAVVNDSSFWRSATPDVPRELQAICAKCVQEEPAARYASASDLAADLHRYLNGQRVLAVGARPITRWLGNHRTPSLVNAALVLALLILVAALVLIRWWPQLTAKEDEPPLPTVSFQIERSEDQVSVAQEMIEKYVGPIEDSLDELADVEYVTTRVRDSQAHVTAHLNRESDKDEARRIVRDKIRTVVEHGDRESFWETTVTPVGREPNSLPLGWIVLTSSEHDPAEATLAHASVVAEQWKKTITSLQNVRHVELAGSVRPILTVEVDPDVLRSYRLSISEVKQAIVRTNFVGDDDDFGKRMGVSILRDLTEFAIDPEALADIVVSESERPVRVKDVATVTRGLDSVEWAWHDGKPCVVLAVFGSSASSPAEVQAKVAARHTELSAELPAAIQSQWLPGNSNSEDRHPSAVGATFVIDIVPIAGLNAEQSQMSMADIASKMRYTMGARTSILAATNSADWAPSSLQMIVFTPSGPVDAATASTMQSAVEAHPSVHSAAVFPIKVSAELPYRNAPVRGVLYGPNERDVQSWSERLRTELLNGSYIGHLNLMLPQRKPEVQLRLKPEAAAVGVGERDVSAAVRAATSGYELDRVPIPSEIGTVETVVQLKMRGYDFQPALEDLSRLTIRGLDGQDRPLDELVSLEFAETPSEFHRFNGRPMGSFWIWPAENTTAEETVARLRHLAEQTAADLRLSSDYHIRILKPSTETD